jgi:hypothetical protein
MIHYRNKTGYKRRLGHRQRYTQVRITGIDAGAKSRSTGSRSTGSSAGSKAKAKASEED